MMQKKKYGALKFCMLGIMLLVGGILGAGGKNETQAINFIIQELLTHRPQR